MRPHCPVCNSRKVATHCKSDQRTKPCGWWTCQNCNANFLTDGKHTHHRRSRAECNACTRT